MQLDPPHETLNGSSTSLSGPGGRGSRAHPRNPSETKARPSSSLLGWSLDGKAPRPGYTVAQAQMYVKIESTKALRGGGYHRKYTRAMHDELYVQPLPCAMHHTPHTHTNSLQRHSNPKSMGCLAIL